MPDNDEFKSDSALNWLEGDKKLLRGIQDIFARNAPQQMEKLREAFDAGDAATAELLSHSIKGSAAMIGALALRDKASGVEASVMAGDLGEARNSFVLMERELEKVLSELKG